jgi:hypothetical protein
MSEKLAPWRNPAVIAAELFRSCQFEMSGDNDDAAIKASYYLFQELIQQLGKDQPRYRELTEQIAVDPEAPDAIALEWEMISGVNRVGRQRARYAFWQSCKPMTKTDVNNRENYAVLDRFDRGVWDNKTREGRPISYLGLAKILAEENKALPREQRKGPGGVEVTALAKHIENLVKRRERELAAGTWFGPITHEQAVRHFGAKNVATISKK